MGTHKALYRRRYLIPATLVVSIVPAKQRNSLKSTLRREQRRYLRHPLPWTISTFPSSITEGSPLLNPSLRASSSQHARRTKRLWKSNAECIGLEWLGEGYRPACPISYRKVGLLLHHHLQDTFLTFFQGSKSKKTLRRSQNNSCPKMPQKK